LRLAAEALRAIANNLDCATGAPSTITSTDPTETTPATAKALSVDELVGLREEILSIIRNNVTDNIGPAALAVKEIFARFSANNVRDLTTHNVAAVLAALREAFPPK
jgi:hypothetical protein